MDRRAFVLLLANAALLPTLVKAHPGIDDWLLEVIPGNSGLRSPSKSGTLSDAQFSIVSNLFLYIGKRWEMDREADALMQSLKFLVVNKTSIEPSYLTEYIEAISIFDRLRTIGLTEELALERMLVPMNLNDTYGSTRIGRAQQYISSELIAWYVCQGGFKRFGYKNYRGFMGGRFIDPQLPYRGI